MLVKAFRSAPERHFLRHLRRSSSLQVSEATRDSIAKRSLHNMLLSKSKGIEKDLHALESELTRSAKKQDLVKIKKKWNLKTTIIGADVTLDSAREALVKDLREELRELMLQSGAGLKEGIQTPHGGIMAAVAASQTEHRNSASGNEPGQSKFALIGAALCLCGLASWKLQEQVQVPASFNRAAQEPFVEAPGPAPGASQHEAPPKAKSTGGEPQKVEAKEPLERQKEGNEGNEGASRLSYLSEDTAQALKLGAGLVLVLGLVWYFWKAPPNPPAPEGPLGQAAQAAQTEAELLAPLRSSSAGPVGASVRTRQAAEVVFENTPKDSQVWDMSASVRGIKGGVSEKVSVFQR